MSDLSSRGSAEREQRREPTVACFCDACDRVLYVAKADLLFCPVCSSTATPVVDSQIDLRSEPLTQP